MTGSGDPGQFVKRAELLSLLREGPRGTAALAATLDCSRSTIHRTTTAFREAGVVEKRGEFHLTGFGRVVTAEVDRYRRRIAVADRLSPFLVAADVDERPPLEAFVDAEVFGTGAGRAHAPLMRITDRIDASESLRLFSSVVSPVYLDRLSRRVREGARVEAVFDTGAVEILFSEFREEVREAVQTGRFEVLVEDGCPFELFVFDEVVGLAARDEGALRAYVESDDPAAVAWGEALYDRVRADARHAVVC